MHIRTALIALLSLASNAAMSVELNAGHVVNVHDGDTLTVLVNKTQIRVRLDSVDAPELKQAFGKRSRRSLAEICAGKAAHVMGQGKDRYGRTIARVTCNGTEANSEQVRRGMAWVYVKYAAKGSPLFELENSARAAKRGLWIQADSVAPWEWRANRRYERTSQ